MSEGHEMGGRAHYKLDAWKLSMELVQTIYSLTQTFPKAEMFGLEKTNAVFSTVDRVSRLITGLRKTVRP